MLLALVGFIAAMGSSPGPGGAGRLFSLELEAAFPMLRGPTPRLWFVARVSTTLVDGVAIGQEVWLTLRCEDARCSIAGMVRHERMAGAAPRLKGRFLRLTEDGHHAVVLPSPFPLQVSEAERRQFPYDPSATRLVSVRYEAAGNGVLEFKGFEAREEVARPPVTWK